MGRVNAKQRGHLHGFPTRCCDFYEPCALAANATNTATDKVLTVLFEHIVFPLLQVLLTLFNDSRRRNAIKLCNKTHVTFIFFAYFHVNQPLTASRLAFLPSIIDFWSGNVLLKVQPHHFRNTWQDPRRNKIRE